MRIDDFERLPNGDTDEPGWVYILRFERPLGNPDKRKGQAQYYVGWCGAGGLERRLGQHRMGYGAAITRAAKERGIGFVLVLCFPGTRRDERKVKNYHNTPKYLERRVWERPHPHRWTQVPF